MSSIEQQLEALGLELPQAAVPQANYVPVVISASQAFVAGQIPFWNGEIKYRGLVGEDLSLEQGQAAAKLCGLNILAQLKLALEGDLDRIVRVVKLGGFVACRSDFTEQHLVMNGVSDLFGEVFGEAGKHARFAVGAPALPLGSAVEVDAVVQIRLP
jgi:enamine deaminase RidA (YjgF/YER057c/UK114 family)